MLQVTVISNCFCTTQLITPEHYSHNSFGVYFLHDATTVHRDNAVKAVAARQTDGRLVVREGKK